jgi:hypothetical protein
LEWRGNFKRFACAARLRLLIVGALGLALSHLQRKNVPPNAPFNPAQS